MSRRLTTITRAESLEAINDMLDSLSSIECRNILRRVSLADLIVLEMAIHDATSGHAESGAAQDDAKPPNAEPDSASGAPE